MEILTEKLLQALSTVIRGKSEALELLVACLYADGHVLIEDVPGTGKTTLARALAQGIGADFRRIQFTPDLMPADVTGGSIYRPQSGDFVLRRGPVFTQLLLADEINRASPRTQSALLEAMEERQTTIEGVAQLLPEPFLVLATQNPVEFHGVFPLPEAQMDRFLVRLELGYPDVETEREVLFGQSQESALRKLQPVLNPAEVLAIRAQVRGVHVDSALASYMVALVDATRKHAALRLGASPRASMALFRVSQARAWMQGRDFIIPDDIQALLMPVLAHRIFPKEGRSRKLCAAVVEEVRRSIAVPL